MYPKIETAVVISDVHVPFQDEHSLASLRKFLYDFQPDYFIINGDFYDFYGISRFVKNPHRTQGGLQKELDLGYLVMKWLIDVIPNAKKVLVEGNHEERWGKFLKSDPNLMSLNSLNLLDNLRITDLGVEYSINSYMLHGLLIKHGTYYNLHSVWKELTDEGCNGTSGHIHRVQMNARTYRSKTNIWVSTGHLADESLMDYTQTGKKVTNHQQSFNVYYFIPDKEVIQPVPVVLKNHSFIFNGKYYVPQRRHLKSYTNILQSLNV